MMGAAFRLMEQRGQFVESPLAKRVLATLHPASVLRATEPATKGRLYTTLVTDLATVAEAGKSKPAQTMVVSGLIL